MEFIFLRQLIDDESIIPVLNSSEMKLALLQTFLWCSFSVVVNVSFVLYRRLTYRLVGKVQVLMELWKSKVVLVHLLLLICIMRIFYQSDHCRSWNRRRHYWIWVYHQLPIVWWFSFSKDSARTRYFWTTAVGLSTYGI